MPYVLSTTVSGVPHLVTCDVENNCFLLLPVQSEAQLSKAFTSPNKTVATSVLKWINANDKKLAKKDIKLEVEAKFR
jgi:hypothetical protein